MGPEQIATLALQALQRGALQQAEQLSHQAYRTEPRNARIVWIYGAVSQARGSYHEAVRAFRKLVDMEPMVAAHSMNLATALRASGDLGGALAAYRDAGEKGEDSADFHYSVGLLQLDLLSINEARPHLERAARLAPLDAEIRFDYARVCFLCVDTDATAAALSDWRSWRGFTTERLAAVASLLLQIGDQQSAEEIIAQLDAAPDRTTNIELQIVGMLERVNRLEEAARRFDAIPAALENSESYLRWLAVHAQISHRLGALDAAQSAYEQLVEACSQDAERQKYLFPLAKVLDEKKEYSRALAIAEQAHVAQWTYTQRLDSNRIDESRPLMAITEYSSDPDDVEQWREEFAPDEQHSPIFIVAFPRSGTTLLEQMLDAHPSLRTMDEQPFLQKATLRFGDLGYSYPHALKSMTADDLAEIRRDYWAMVRQHLTLRPGQRLIDKNPLNMLRLPAIKRLFPNSPILLAIRHPCDVIISNFFQHYRAPEFIRLCRDLPTLALAYRKSFDYWYQQAEILQPRAFEIRYELFVADFERQARAIASFVNVDWHEQMLRPAEHARGKGFISTPSYSQVVQPVNSKAVNRWRRYETAMAPVVAEIRPYLRRWGYDV